MSRPSLFVFVVDVSADHHAARMISRLKEMQPDLHIWGVGGERMKEQGVELLYESHTFATVGLIEVIRYLPLLKRVRERVLKEIAERKPDVVLLVDFAGFNLGLAQLIRPKHPDLPIVYFISPQIWGSRPWRITVVQRTVTKMLTIFPFEESLYKDAAVDASFVGHPLTLAIPEEVREPNKEEFCAANGLDASRPLIGIFPGSRRQEIKDLLPVVLQAVKWLQKQRPELQFAISRANTILSDAMDQVIDQEGMRLSVGHGLALLPIGDNHSLMRAADILWAKSGTTTLEAALFGKPMLIYYRGNWLSFLIFLLFKRVRRVGWPNILAGKGVVPELLQLDCRPEQFVKYTSDWLDVPGARQEISEDLSKVRSMLGQGDFAESAASEVLKILSSRLVGSGDAFIAKETG